MVEGGASRSAEVLQFRPRQRVAEPSLRQPSLTQPNLADPYAAQPDDEALLDDLSRYEQDREDEPVNYARRMLMNLIAIAVVAVLIGVGVWLADTIAQMERDQDCVLQGRHNCAPIEVPVARPL